jgi:hypothetical protein
MGKAGKGTTSVVPFVSRKVAALAAEGHLRSPSRTANLVFAEEFFFGWRSAFSAAIRPFFPERALAPEGAGSRFII